MIITILSSWPKICMLPAGYHGLCTFIFCQNNVKVKVNLCLLKKSELVLAKSCHCL